MKKLYLVVNGVSVYGASFDSADDAVENANEWWDDNNEERGVIDSIAELDVPETATHDDFIDCAYLSDYEDRANQL
jgi:hypothetical protein